MITLENVSAESFLNFSILEGISRDDSTYKFISDLLTKNNITNFKMLKELLENENIKEKNLSAYILLRSRIKEIEGSIAVLNFTHQKLPIYSFNCYEKVNIDEKTAHITDENNKGIILPHNFPFLKTSASLCTLNELSILKIKELLNSIDSYDLTKCALTSKSGIGIKTLQKTLNLIDFYEQQVVRQALETEQRGINLFTLNKEEKDKIVDSNLQEYIEYILDNAFISIWGGINSIAIDRIYNAIILSKGKHTKEIKKTIIDMISNYTTLKELETGILIEQEVPIVMGSTIIKKKIRPIDRIIE